MNAFWAMLLRRRSCIRLREPQQFRLITGADRERIDATFDPAGRIVSLVDGRIASDERRAP